jgi:hypothetical protein
VSVTEQEEAEATLVRQSVEDSELALTAQAAAIDERLSTLEAAVAALVDEIRAATHVDEMEEDDSESAPRLQKLANTYAHGREIEWEAFDAANTRAQEIVDEATRKVITAMDDAKMMERLGAAEERAKWCSNRLVAWAAESKKRESLGVGTEELWAMLEEFEQAVVAAEKSMAEMDEEEEPEEFEKYEPVLLKDEPSPMPAMNGVAPPLKFPDDLRLAYVEVPDFMGLPVEPTDG